MTTCLWFDKQAKEAFDFYATVFDDINLKSENPMAVNYTLGGRRFMHLMEVLDFPLIPLYHFFITQVQKKNLKIFGISSQKTIRF